MKNYIYIFIKRVQRMTPWLSWNWLPPLCEYFCIPLPYACILFCCNKTFLETSGSSHVRSMLRWVSVRQTVGGRRVGGSVNQNNTLSWCEIRLTTTLQIWIAHWHTHIHSRLPRLPKDKNCGYLYWIRRCSIFQCSPPLFCAHSCLHILCFLLSVLPSTHFSFSHLTLSPSLSLMHTQRLSLPPSLTL